TKLVTGFSYEDSRTFSKFSAWASRQDLDLQQVLPGAPGHGAVPTKQKIAKAQAFVGDLVSVAHLDEMAADIKRFVPQVYAGTAPMSEEDREELRGQADQFEFMYNMQKAVALAAAPSVVAAALSDEQLAAFHGFVRSQAFTKACDLLRDAVHSGTAFTKDDILEAQKAFDTLEKNAKLRERDGTGHDQDHDKCADWI